MLNMFKFANSQQCGSVLILLLSMRMLLGITAEERSTSVASSEWFNISMGSKSHQGSDNTHLICEKLNSTSTDPVQNVHNHSEMESDSVKISNANVTDSITSVGLSSTNHTKLKELEDDRDTFFTWESIVLHIVVFFACFLLY